MRPKALISAEAKKLLHKKGGQVTKPIVKICYKLLYIILGVKSIFDEVTSWPQLISKLLVASACLHAASDWPRTFFTPKVFLFSISLLFVNKYHYFVKAYKQMLLLSLQLNLEKLKTANFFNFHYRVIHHYRLCTCKSYEEGPRYGNYQPAV